MAKKIRFPLEMGNGIEVRTLEELQENFSIERVLGYYTDGKLITWLKDRYLDDIADVISGLNKEDSDFAMKICAAFDVEYSDEVDMQALEERNRKLALLKQYTDKKEYFDVVDDVAFNQDELYDLLDEEKHTIYLCGDSFSIPLSKKGIHYIGVNSPEAVISSKQKVDFEERGIRFQNIKFDKLYMDIISVNNAESKEKESFLIQNGYSEVGDIVKFGAYWIESGQVKDDIEWIILKKKGSRVLLITRFCLEAMPFHSSSSNWESSDVHCWLNGEFRRIAFDDLEQKKIDGDIFLLSEKEADSLFTSDKERSAKPTKWAVEKGVFVDYRFDGNTSWWLRTPYGIKKICYVTSFGIAGNCTEVRADGLIITPKVEGVGAVRPAMWIDL